MQGSTLKRSLNLPLITFYGIGTILGAGIYVLVGKVAGFAGSFAPWAFLLAAIVATFTGLSYAELSSRFPKSAGEAFYIRQGMQQHWLATLVGWLVVLTGIVSCATLLHGFVGYLHVFVALPSKLIIIILIIGLCSLAAWGITESVTTITIITLLEIFGLIFVVALSFHNLAKLPTHLDQLTPSFHWSDLKRIALGGFLAFYAFIGFEDMVNCAEEVKNPEKNLPRAIIIALIITTVLYVIVALVAVLTLPVSKLAGSEAPLALMVIDSGYSPITITLISLVAVINGALVQVIMASRVIYGLGRQRGAPKLLTRVNQKTQTPILATVIVGVGILLFALWLPLVQLAQTTSFVILIVFALVNLALIQVKRKSSVKPVVSFPIIIPVIGFLLCCGLILIRF